jgi:CcdB protein
VENFLMAGFNVYASPGAHASTTPYLFDLQSNLLDGLDSRKVIPSSQGSVVKTRQAGRHGEAGQ